VKRTAIILVVLICIASLMVLTALQLQIPLATNSDFQVLYYTTHGLVEGVGIYDQTAKIQMISEILQAPLKIDFIPQFAYPPWLALSTFYLGWFSIQSAAVLWFEINLVMLFLSIWFLTEGWKPLFRLLAFPAGLFFYPVLGALAIGQYDFPVLLGTSMLIYSIRHRQPVLTALGISLLTFKPHLGGLILVAGLIHLFLRRDEFGRRAFRYSIVAGIFLFIIGFLAGSTWPLAYLTSLLNYRDLGHITSCSECISLPILLSRWLFDGQLATAAWIALLLFILFVIVFYLTRSLWKPHDLLLTAALLVTLLVSPYLYNYDFILLLVPFAILLYKSSLVDKISVACCYFVPTFALIAYGRSGNSLLIVVTGILLLLLYLRARFRSLTPDGVRHTIQTTTE
jgi:hypothetical protein